jgi:structural maintenance of chromosome 1
VVPSKRYRPIELLSGGEKTLAALALLFAIHSYQPTPVVLLDEFGAALDSENVRKLASFLNAHTEAHSNTASNAIATHFIVVTHKRSMFWRAQSVLGLFATQQKVLTGLSSGALMLDLVPYCKLNKPKPSTAE